MNKIIYVDGKLADQLGKAALTQLGQLAADHVQMPVDILTYGNSEFHEKSRLTCKPKPEIETKA